MLGIILGAGKIAMKKIWHLTFWREHTIGLVKKFIWVFLLHHTEKPKLFDQTQYIQ